MAPYAASSSSSSSEADLSLSFFFGLYVFSLPIFTYHVLPFPRHAGITRASQMMHLLQLLLLAPFFFFYCSPFPRSLHAVGSLPVCLARLSPRARATRYITMTHACARPKGGMGRGSWRRFAERSARISFSGGRLGNIRPLLRACYHHPRVSAAVSAMLPIPSSLSLSLCRSLSLSSPAPGRMSSGWSADAFDLVPNKYVHT